jgi:hypothetical protein
MTGQRLTGNRAPHWATTPTADTVRDALNGQPDHVVAAVCAATEAEAPDTARSIP